MFPCFRVSMFFRITQKVIDLWNMKFDYIVLYENIMDKFNIGHRRTKVKVMVRL